MLIHENRFMYLKDDNLNKFINNFLEVEEKLYLSAIFNKSHPQSGKGVYLCFTNKRIVEFFLERTQLNKFNVEYMEKYPEDISNILDSALITSYLNDEIKNFATASDNFSTIVQFEYKNEELKFVHLEAPELLLKGLDNYKNFNAH